MTSSNKAESADSLMEALSISVKKEMETTKKASTPSLVMVAKPKVQLASQKAGASKLVAIKTPENDGISLTKKNLEADACRNRCSRILRVSKY